MKWFRFYDEVLDDPKVQRLPADLRWYWTMLLCIANRNANRGTLPDIADIAFHLRISESDTEQVVAQLAAAGLVDADGNGRFTMHNWNGRQRVSDDVSQRVQKHREHVTRNVTETVPRARVTDTETDTETDTDTESMLVKGGVGENTPAPPKPATKRKSQVPEDWQPSEKGRDYALSKGMAAADIAHEVGKFRNHHRSRGTLFLDIDAAWRTWSDNHAQFSRARAPNANGRHIEARDNYGDFSGPDKGGTVDPETGEPIPIHKWGSR
jgi:hypothetical protein